MNKIIFSLCLVLFSASASQSQEATSAAQRLRNQDAQFQEQVVKVADKVHVAVGFSPANVSMIEGDDGLVIIDTGMSVDDGTRIMEEFRKLNATARNYYPTVGRELRETTKPANK